MYFILSKLLIYLIYPLTWIIVALISGLLIKNKKYARRFLLTGLILLLLFSNKFLLNQFAQHWDVYPDTVKTNGHYSCALVLGGFVSEDKTKTGYFNWASDRFIQAIELQESGRTDHLLFSGGDASLHPDGFIEGNWISSQLKDFHFPDSTILFETRSRNTIENIQFSKLILQEKHLPPPYILVTSAFHMRRALLICKKENLNVTAYPCNYFAGKNSISTDDFIPSAETLYNWNIYIKELVGYAVTAIKL